MTLRLRSALERYGLACFAVAIAFVLKRFVDPWIEADLPFMLFLGGVLVSSWYGGFAPGLLATAVALLLFAVHLDASMDAFPAAQRWARLGLFVVEGAVVSALGAAGQRLWTRARKQRDWLGAILANIGDGVLALAPDGRVIYLNPIAEAMTGWRLDVGSDRPVEGVVRLLDPQSGEPVPVGDPAGGWRPCLLEGRDGSRTRVDHRASPLLDRAGRAAGTLVVLRDRTEAQARQRSEDELKKSEARFRQLADAMPQIVWSAGPTGRIDYYNRRWTEFTGLSPSQSFAAEGWWRLVVHPDDAEVCAARWAEAVRTGQPFQMECRFQVRTEPAESPAEVTRYEVTPYSAPPAPRWSWYLARAVPVTDESGAVLRWYGSCTDIDDQKRAAEAAREMSRRKDEFLAMLSHELRSPLAPILNSLQLLRLADLSDPAQVAAREVIDRQVRHLANMVDGLLEVFGIVHQKVTLTRAPLELSALAQRALDEFRPTIEGAGVALEFRAPEQPVWVHGDQARLRQVLTNLLQNAAKFTSAGGRIEVRLDADAAQQRAVITVRDTGAGLAPEMMDEIFEAFGQGRQNIARRLGGLGLGLALVRGIVELHGGRVHAASAGPGRGSEFTFWLPLGRKPATPSAPAAPGFGPVEKGHAEPGEPHLRLLIVEDNEDTAATLQVLLRRFGHEVRVAHDGRAGVDLAKGWHPDVVLCDLGLPEMDGFEVANSLRHDPETAATRLIAISGYGREEDRRRSEEVGFDLHLTKPVDPLQLRRLLNVLKVGE